MQMRINQNHIKKRMQFFLSHLKAPEWLFPPKTENTSSCFCCRKKKSTDNENPPPLPGMCFGFVLTLFRNEIIDEEKKHFDRLQKIGDASDEKLISMANLFSCFQEHYARLALENGHADPNAPLEQKEDQESVKQRRAKAIEEEAIRLTTQGQKEQQALFQETYEMYIAIHMLKFAHEQNTKPPIRPWHYKSSLLYDLMTIAPDAPSTPFFIKQHPTFSFVYRRGEIAHTLKKYLVENDFVFIASAHQKSDTHVLSLRRRPTFYTLYDSNITSSIVRNKDDTVRPFDGYNYFVFGEEDKLAAMIEYYLFDGFRETEGGLPIEIVVFEKILPGKTPRPRLTQSAHLETLFSYRGGYESLSHLAWDNSSPWQLALDYNSTEVALFFLQHGILPTEDDLKRTIKNHNERLTRTLLDHGAPINRNNTDLLYTAVYHQQDYAVQALLERGIKPNAQCFYDATPSIRTLLKEHTSRCDFFKRHNWTFLLFALVGFLPLILHLQLTVENPSSSKRRLFNLLLYFYILYIPFPLTGYAINIHNRENNELGVICKRRLPEPNSTLAICDLLDIQPAKAAPVIEPPVILRQNPSANSSSSSSHVPEMKQPLLGDPSLSSSIQMPR